MRRLQYFDRNTTLAGAAFDFHGEARAILRGSVLAVVLLTAYHYAFGFSLVFGLIVVAVLLLSLPFMMRGALRFRLGNTSWRGLRFHFTGSVPLAYRTYLAPIAVFLLPGVLVAILGNSPWSFLPFALYLAWPAMYGWMKRYQYGHVAYGNQHSWTNIGLYEFFAMYARGLGLAALPILALVVLAVAGKPLSDFFEGRVLTVLGAIGAVSVPLMAYVLLGPYQQVRTLNLCLPNTDFPGVRFVSTLSARAYSRLQLKNLVLTLLSLGRRAL